MWRIKAKYATFCVRCAGQISIGAWITEVGGAWVHDRCPKHDYEFAPAKVGAKESNTMTEAIAAQHHPSKAQFDKLVTYIQELVADHNRLEERVIQLESYEKTRQRIENEQEELKAEKLAAKTGKFQGRDAALEAEA